MGNGPEFRCTPEMEHKVLRLFERGDPIASIARDVEISRPTVYRILGDHGLKRKPGTRIEKLHRAAMRLSHEGLRYANGQMDKETWVNYLGAFEATWKEL